MKHGLFQAKSLKTRKVISKFKKIKNILKQSQQTMMCDGSKNVQKIQGHSHNYLLGGIKKYTKKKCSDQPDSDGLDD